MAKSTNFLYFTRRLLSTNPNRLITVFYDGKCGLCSKEINHYKKIAPQGIFNWQDITECDKELVRFSKTI